MTAQPHRQGGVVVEHVSDWQQGHFSDTVILLASEQQR